jgi:DNA-binding IclR family transcriptional regulator
VPARRGIQSLETGLRVLAALSAGQGPQTLTIIGARAGISPSQTHRYLQSLVAAGMAVQDSSARYDLGPAAIAVGIAALARLDVFARACSAIAGFVAETGRTAAISVWGEAGPVVVRWFPGSPPVQGAIPLGTVLSLRHSAAGRVFLAFLHADETGAALERERHADHSVLHVDLPAICAGVRTSLLGTGEPMLMPGLRSLAAPVFDLQGRLALVASCLATQAFAMEEDEAVATRLLAACRLATQAGGGTWPG